MADIIQIVEYFSKGQNDVCLSTLTKTEGVYEPYCVSKTTSDGGSMIGRSFKTEADTKEYMSKLPKAKIIKG